MSDMKQTDNLRLAKALIRAGITPNLILKAAAISEYQFEKLRRELTLQT